MPVQSRPRRPSLSSAEAQRIAAAGIRLHGELSALYELVPHGIRSTRLLARHLGLNRNICQRFIAAVQRGGDGLAIARIMMENNYPVKIFIAEEGITGTADFRVNLERLQSVNADVQFISSPGSFPAIASGAVVIDALFGTGLNKPPTGIYAMLIEHINNCKATVIAIDLPSGLYADHSSAGNTIINATHTLSFQQYKLAFLLPESAAFCGHIEVLDIGLQMSKEANNLTSALKGDSQQRGAWGEAQLRRTLEMSGLIEEAHYEVQSSFKDADGKQKQTDYLIKLPDGKHIIIDSKVALNAYDRAVGAESPEEYQLAMSDHVKAVRKHIDDLASKDYTNLVGMRSPSFVLMFMPIEPAYIEALKNNKDLFEYGYKKGIVLVSHTTLIPILRTVSNLWMIERSNAEAREISEKAGDIFIRF